MLTARNSDQRLAPRFDLRLIQRYVLWRVFDLGWTTERFGHFDRFSIGHDGRQASRAERIGKKYQWIAYHEIMALVADHFQYLGQFREKDGDQAYDGPWQDYLRDIDPSCTLRATPGGTCWDGQSLAWWGAARYEDWGDPGAPREWVMGCDDLPKVEDLLGLRWSGNGADYLDAADRRGAFDPTAHADGPNALLLRLDLLREFLAREQLTICWAVLGEKRALGAGFRPEHYGSVRMGGAYVLGDKGPVGFLKCTLDDREADAGRSPRTPLATIRTPA